jgi:hypothetical protein
MLFLIFSLPLKDFLVLDLAPYPVSGPLLNSILSYHGLSGDYVTSEDYLDSLANYKSVWVITSGNTQRWVVTFQAVAKFKSYLELGRRGLFWQGYWDWFNDPGSSALRLLMGVDEPEFYVWNWYISLFEPAVGETVFVNSFPWIMVDFETTENFNKSEYLLEGIRLDRPGQVDVHPAVYGKIMGSRTVALGFDIVAIWGPTSRLEFIDWILDYFSFNTANNTRNRIGSQVKLTKNFTYGITGRRETPSKNGYYFEDGKLILYLRGNRIICKFKDKR